MNVLPVRLIDTNIILRFLRRDDQTLSSRAKKYFIDAEEGKQFCYLDEIVIAEAIWVLTSVYKTKRDSIAHMLEALLIHDWIINPRKKTIFRALAFYRKNTLNYIDCWLLAVSEERQIILETFDKKLQKISLK